MYSPMNRQVDLALLRSKWIRPVPLALWSGFRCSKATVGRVEPIRVSVLLFIIEFILTVVDHDAW